MHDSTGWGQSGRDTALRLLKDANLSLVAGGKELIEGVMAVTSYTPEHSANARAIRLSFIADCRLGEAESDECASREAVAGLG